MTTLDLDVLDASLVVSAPAPTYLVAALDPPAVLEVAPQAAVLAVTAVQSGVLTAPAAQGPIGAPGKNGLDGGNLTYSFSFPAALAVWFVAHNLGRFPSVTIVDTTGDQVFADLTYLDANTLRMAFGLPMAGVVYLN